MNNDPVYCAQSTHPRAHELYMHILEPLRSDHALSTGILRSDVSDHAYYIYRAHLQYYTYPHPDIDMHIRQGLGGVEELLRDWERTELLVASEDAVVL